MRHTLSLSLVLFAVWLLWSGHALVVQPDGSVEYDSLLLGLGVLASALVVFLVRRMHGVDMETAPHQVTLRILRYLPWLFWEIAKANVAVARVILHPRLPIRPTLVRVRAGQRTDLGRVIHANSITLTPGTVSVEVESDAITVHALTEEAALDLDSGEMNRRVTAVEGRG